MAVVVIDSGHGGTTKIGGSSPNNATGPNGTLEKTLTLKVGLAVERAFAGTNVTVLMTRRDDRNVGIDARAKVARDADADAFVSLHFNAAPTDGPAAQGTETWIGVGHNRVSRALADLVHQDVLGVTGLRNRRVKVGNVSGVIRPGSHDSHTASCLVEISFIDRQPAEERRLASQAHIDDLGGAVAHAILSSLRERGLLPAVQMMLVDDEPEDAASARRLGLLKDLEPADAEAASLSLHATNAHQVVEGDRVSSA